MAQEKQNTFVAEPRNDFGKGYARRLRVAGRVPAVIYGHGQEPAHVSLDRHEVTLAVRSPNALMNISLNGKKQITIAKDVQRHPVRRTVDHLDLLIVRAGETVTVEVPVIVVGEPHPGSIVQLEAANIVIEAEATHLPEELNVDVTDCRVGTHISAGDIKLPQGVNLVTEAETLMVVVSEPQAAGSETAAKAVTEERTDSGS